MFNLIRCSRFTYSYLQDSMFNVLFNIALEANISTIGDISITLVCQWLISIITKLFCKSLQYYANV
jgi:hypothetical protein